VADEWENVDATAGRAPRWLRITLVMSQALSNSQSGPHDDSNRQFFVFDLHAETKALKAQPPANSGRITRMLVSLPTRRVLLVWMKSGARWDEHTAPGRITVQTLVGRIRMTVSEQTLDAPSGRIIILNSHVPHDVNAIEESVFLLTVDRDAA